MLLRKVQKLLQMMLAASIGLHWEETTEEQPTQHGMESLVRSGRTLNPMITSSLISVITTSAEILLGVVLLKYGAIPQIPSIQDSYVQFPSVPHQKGK